jgi:hypothetical protein
VAQHTAIQASVFNVFHSVSTWVKTFSHKGLCQYLHLADPIGPLLDALHPAPVTGTADSYVVHDKQQLQGQHFEMHHVIADAIQSEPNTTKWYQTTFEECQMRIQQQQRAETTIIFTPIDCTTVVAA